MTLSRSLLAAIDQAVVSTEVVHLQNLEAGRAALERARDQGEVRQIKEIMDVASAARRFADAQHMSEDAKRFAAEMELDAKRYLGEVLAQATPHPGGRPAEPDKPRSAHKPVPGGNRFSQVVAPPSLAELGISKKQSAQAQKVAAIPEADYEHFKKHSAPDEINTSQAIRLHRDIVQTGVEPIIDSAMRDRRLTRVRMIKLAVEAAAMGAFLHGQLDQVVEALQHDGADRWVQRLRQSAELMNLVADTVDAKPLRRVK
jgi:hypothetical protein